MTLLVVDESNGAFINPGHKIFSPMTDWYVYILRCRDGSLYTGYTNDLNSRIEKHNAGRGAKYTASRRPVRMVYREPAETKVAAMKREIQIKRWTKAQKEALIAGNRLQLKSLSNAIPVKFLCPRSPYNLGLDRKLIKP